VDRYSFVASDSHRLLLAGLSGSDGGLSFSRLSYQLP
jgi:hypothetical protein